MTGRLAPGRTLLAALSGKSDLSLGLAALREIELAIQSGQLVVDHEVLEAVGVWRRLLNARIGSGQRVGIREGRRARAVLSQHVDLLDTAKVSPEARARDSVLAQAIFAGVVGWGTSKALDALIGTLSGEGDNVWGSQFVGRLCGDFLRLLGPVPLTGGAGLLVLSNCSSVAVHIHALEFVEPSGEANWSYIPGDPGGQVIREIAAGQRMDILVEPRMMTIDKYLGVHACRWNESSGTFVSMGHMLVLVESVNE